MKTDNPTNTTLATLPARLRRTFLAQDQQTRALLERLPSDKLEQVLACYKETPLGRGGRTTTTSGYKPGSHRYPWGR